MTDAILLLEEHDRLAEEQREEIRLKIEEGWQQSERGEVARMLPDQSRAAEADILGIWFFVAQDSLVSADRVLATIRSTCERAAEPPSDRLRQA